MSEQRYTIGDNVGGYEIRDRYEAATAEAAHAAGREEALREVRETLTARATNLEWQAKEAKSERGADIYEYAALSVARCIDAVAATRATADSEATGTPGSEATDKPCPTCGGKGTYWTQVYAGHPMANLPCKSCGGDGSILIPEQGELDERP